MMQKKKKSILINKETGKEISNLINKIDPITGEEVIIRNLTSNSLNSSSSEINSTTEILSVKDLESGNNIIIDKETGEK